MGSEAGEGPASVILALSMIPKHCVWWWWLVAGWTWVMRWEMNPAIRDVHSVWPPCGSVSEALGPHLDSGLLSQPFTRAQCLSWKSLKTEAPGFGVGGST